MGVNPRRGFKAFASSIEDHICCPDHWPCPMSRAKMRSIFTDFVHSPRSGDLPTLTVESLFYVHLSTGFVERLHFLWSCLMQEL